MNPADRPHFHGHLRPMDHQPPAGPAPVAPAALARTRIVVALSGLGLVAAAILLALLS